MSIVDLDSKSRVELLGRLQMTYDSSLLEEEFDIAIPQWLTIKYKCISCSKVTRVRVQTKSIPQANRQLTCPFCRKVSQMSDIHVEKESTDLSRDDFTGSRRSDSNPLQFH